MASCSTLMDLETSYVCLFGLEGKMNELLSSYNLFTPSWNILGCPEGVKNSFIQIFQKDSLVDGLYCGHSMPGDIMQCLTLGLILKENM